MNSSSAPTFTIFIPSYNRAKLLPRAFASIERQTFHDFDVVIIDDGSTDNTQQVVTKWSQRVNFPVFYKVQANQGKPAAHNTALEYIKGFFTVILDSDDALADNALMLLKGHWDNIPENKRKHFAGVEGNCALLCDNRISGNLFPSDVFDSDYLETRYTLNIAGDKKNALRTDVLKAFPFPLFLQEKSIRESVIWNRIATHYKMRYINEIIQYIEYQPDGLSKNIFKRRMQNPQGFRLAHQEMVNRYRHYLSKGELFNEVCKYIRFSFHCGLSLKQQRQEIKQPIIWLLMLIKGYVNYRLDQRKMTKLNK